MSVIIIFRTIELKLESIVKSKHSRVNIDNGLCVGCSVDLDALY